MMKILDMMGVRMRAGEATSVWMVELDEFIEEGLGVSAGWVGDVENLVGGGV